MFKLCTSNTTCRPRSVCLPGLRRLAHDVWPECTCVVYMYVAAESIGETKDKLYTYAWTIETRERYMCVR